VEQLGIVQFVAFLIGLLFGSFLNVCISRVPQGESVVAPRSRCPQCGSPIRWYDNIPVLSWPRLSARCRDCNASIPWRYPVVELSLGVWFLLIGVSVVDVLFGRGAPPLEWNAWWINFVVDQTGLAILGFLLIGLMVMDWQTMTLPDSFTLTGIAIGFLLVCLRAVFLGPGEDQVVLNTTHQLRLNSPGSFISRGNVFLTGPEAVVFGRIAAICGVALLLLLIRWVYKVIRHREGMGLGDVKLLAMIAAFLGFWPAILSLFVGTLTAALYGALLLARGKAGAASKLAFGSFLCVGGLVAARFGNRLIDMYMALLR
jgi:leader peptidase (prepilin peptidase) / N-methyltransferase